MQTIRVALAIVLGCSTFAFAAAKPKGGAGQSAASKSPAAALATPAPAPLSEAAGRMTVPPGFDVSLFAGEPDVVQPIAFTFDDRGRMWVVECRSYPKWHLDESQPGQDRILIFEDTDGDGKFDRKTVFAEGLRNVSAIEVGFGGVWVGAIPNLLFIPDQNGDDNPDGPPQVLLDGWNLREVRHNIFSSFTWGPDGWLWATNGIQSKSLIGKPGTPEDKRIRFDCGVWRYHPTRHVFEVVAVGTTNPWGLDFDANGQAFITNCVIAHLWHVIPGAYYQRMYGQHFNPYHYGYMQTCADHLHWVGEKWQDGRGGPAQSDAGGGHAHVGAMVYQADQWPAEYRGGIYMCNLHGNRINHDVFAPKGSGVVASHGKDFLLANDPWFRGLAIHQGPDGSAFVTDWSDTGECHNYEVVDQSNGRIYRVAYGTPKPLPAFDLAKKSDAELVALLGSENVWWARHAQRLLQERAADGKLSPATVSAIEKDFGQAKTPAVALRLMWAMNAVGQSDKAIQNLLSSNEPYAVGWGIRLAVETGRPSDAVLVRFAELAGKSQSQVVRLHLASALQRLPLAERWPIAEPLVGHGDDESDANLPLMDWFGIEPLVPADLSRALQLAERSKLSIVRQYIARRACEGADPKGLAAVTALLTRIQDPAGRQNVLQGMNEALDGMRDVAKPAGWAELYPKLVKSASPAESDLARALAVVFGEQQALEEIRQQAADPKRDPAARQRAIQSLVNAKAPGLANLLHGLLNDRDVREVAIRSLAAVGDADSAKELLKRYKTYSSFEKPLVVQTLVSRPTYALALLDAVAAGTVAKDDLSAVSVRQISNMADDKVQAKLKDVWGDVRPTEQDKLAKLAKLKEQFTPDDLKAADLGHGRAVFDKTCAACHTMFDAGGKVGPNLTGSQRAVTAYILENVTDPSAQVAKEYRATLLETKDGRSIEGLVIAETPQSLTVRTSLEDLHIQTSDIESRRLSPLSMMPEGLFDGLKWEEQRDLLGYLASPQQVAPSGLPPAATSAEQSSGTSKSAGSNPNAPSAGGKR